MMKRIFYIVFMMVMICACSKGSPSEKKHYPIGMYLENGKYMLEGNEFYGIGANYFDMFLRGVSKDDDSGLTGMRELKKAGVPFIRFSASPYAPDSWKPYFENKEAYFAFLDRFVREAERLRIGLIPCLFWHTPTFPDLNGEHQDQYANPSSKTIAFIKSYTQEVVERYKDSPAIWGWEFSNEYSLQIDIPGEGYIPALLPGSPFPERDMERDKLSQEGMVLSLSIFAETIRAIDKTRPIFSGNDSPRASAYHNTNDNPNDDWTPDNENQYRLMVERYESCVNTITTRGYYNYGSNRRNYPLGFISFSDFLKWLRVEGERLGKPVFVGEFGGLPQWTTENKDWIRYDDIRVAWKERFDAVVNNRIQLSAFWNYDYLYADDKEKISKTNDPNGILKMLKEYNDKLNRLTK